MVFSRQDAKKTGILRSTTPMSTSLRSESFGQPARQIASSTLWQIGSQVVMAALSILTTKFVAIGLTKELAGNYNSAYGYLQLFGILADFGLYAVAVREVARAVPAGRGVLQYAPTEHPKKNETREDVLGALIVLRCIIMTISLGSALFLIWTLPQWRGTPLPLGVTIAILVPFFTLLAGIIRTVFQVTYRMHFVFIAEVTQRIISTALIGLFIVMGIRQSHDLQIYHMFLYAGGVGAFVLFFLSLVFGNRLMPLWGRNIPALPNIKLLKRLFLLAAPYGIAFLFTALYRQFDTTLIALLRPDYEIQNAYYGFVVRMTDMAYLIPTFLLNSTLPIVSERDSKGEDTSGLLGKTFLILLTLGSISLLFAMLWSRPLVALLTTDAYLSTPFHPGTDTALFLLGIPMFLNGIIQYSFYVLLTRHRWQQLVATLGIGVVLSLGLNLWLIPLLGFRGNAITSIVVHTLLAILLLPQAIRTMPLRLPVNGLMRWLLFSIGLGLGLGLGKPFLTGNLMTVIGLGVATAWMGILFWMTRMKEAVM